jgi:N-acetylglutamate synthase-like GNAT family acetyltransferase
MAHECRKIVLEKVRQASGVPDGESIVDWVADLKAKLIRAEEKQAETEGRLKGRQDLIEIWQKDFWELARLITGKEYPNSSTQDVLVEGIKKLKKDLELEKGAYVSMKDCAEHWYAEAQKNVLNVAELPRAKWMDCKSAAAYRRAENFVSPLPPLGHVTIKLECEAPDCASNKGEGLQKYEHVEWAEYIRNHCITAPRPRPAILCEHCLKRLALDDADLLPS